MGPFEKIEDQIRGVFNFGGRFCGPGLGSGPPLKNPWRRPCPGGTLHREKSVTKCDATNRPLGHAPAKAACQCCQCCQYQQPASAQPVKPASRAKTDRSRSTDNNRVGVAQDMLTIQGNILEALRSLVAIESSRLEIEGRRLVLEEERADKTKRDSARSPSPP